MEPKLAPNDLFRQFRKLNAQHSYQTLLRFNQMSREQKQEFIEPTFDFINSEVVDNIRCWGTSVLEFVGGDKPFEFLANLIEEADKGAKQNYRFTRFYGLRALKRIALSENKLDRLLSICEKIDNDQKEGEYVRLGAKSFLSQYGKPLEREKYEEELRALLNSEDYRETARVLYALREFPLPALQDKLLQIVRDRDRYLDFRHRAIEALGSLGSEAELSIIRGLGEIAVSTPERYLRLEAVESLWKLANPTAQGDLLQAIEKDEDAEIKARASNALVDVIGKEKTVSLVVQEALSHGLEEAFRDNLVESLRRIDRGRTIASEILSKELSGEDEERVRMAEKMLLDLGGWAAFQSFRQRQSTLKDTNQLLEDSEKVIQSTFESTIRQARNNFYFAMMVNVLIVVVGVALIIIAINQLIHQPEKLESWIIPGGAGLIGVILNIGFNNPRRNAREDLGTLMFVNVLFLGFLRQLGEIDATFKHGYLENRDFDIQDMQGTVEQIQDAMHKTLSNGARYLQITQVSMQTEEATQLKTRKPGNE